MLLTGSNSMASATLHPHSLSSAILSLAAATAGASEWQGMLLLDAPAALLLLLGSCCAEAVSRGTIGCQAFPLRPCCLMELSLCAVSGV
jgi:hypothetical protein